MIAEARVAGEVERRGSGLELALHFAPAANLSGKIKCPPIRACQRRDFPTFSVRR